MKKISTAVTSRARNFTDKKLTIGLDLGDRFSHYCILNEAGEVVAERKIPTTRKGMEEAFRRMPPSRIAMETGTHSPWVSRVLAALGHEVIVAHAQKVRLIAKSRRKDDRLDARTLARLARIDPELLNPVQHRSAPGPATPGRDPRTSGTGKQSNCFGEYCPRISEVIRRTAAEV